jgi:hypothetical protein
MRKTLTLAVVLLENWCLASGAPDKAPEFLHHNRNTGYITAALDGSDHAYHPLDSPDDSSINFVGAAFGDGTPEHERARVVILGYDLPTLSRQPSRVTLTVVMRRSDAVSSGPWFNVDLYGFTSTPSSEFFFAGKDDPDPRVSKVAEAVMHPRIRDGEVVVIDVTDFVLSLYRENKPLASAVYFRFSPDEDLRGGDGMGRYRPLFNTRTLHASLRMVPTEADQ